MWTKNYQVIKKMNLPGSNTSPFGSSYSYTSANGGGLYPLTAVDGQTRYIKPLPPTYVWSISASIGNIGHGWRVGSGTSAESEDDYTITPITSGATISSVASQVYDENAGKCIQRVVLTLIANESMTVSEVGNFVQITAVNTEGGTSTNNRIFLVFRKTFTPVTLSAGDTLAITISWELPVPLTE